MEVYFRGGIDYPGAGKKIEMAFSWVYLYANIKKIIANALSGQLQLAMSLSMQQYFMLE